LFALLTFILAASKQTRKEPLLGAFSAALKIFLIQMGITFTLSSKTPLK
jgi:hypothetical protein